MPFSHLITLISNAHILLLALAARAISHFRPSYDGLSRRIASRRSAPTQCVPFQCPASLLSWSNVVWGMSTDFLERPVFIKINPARSVAVKLLPAPCRGVSSKALREDARLHQRSEPGSQPGVIPSSRCRRHPFRGMRVLCFMDFLVVARRSCPSRRAGCAP